MGVDYIGFSSGFLGSVVGEPVHDWDGSCHAQSSFFLTIRRGYMLPP
jgi:hypothetical protein